MTKIVFDASAVLALLNKETGEEIVEQHLPNSILSTVNLAEAVAALIDIGISREEAESTITELVTEIISFDQQQACIAADLRKITKSYGLSLGDRACLALAQMKNIPVLTADKIWKNINHSTEIICIR